MNMMQKSSSYLILSDYLIRYKYQTSVFLLTMVLNPIYASPVGENTMTVSEFPFYGKLRYPCSFVNESGLQRETIKQGDRANIHQIVVNEMKSKSLKLRDRAETIHRTDVSEDCTTLQLPAVAIIPSDVYISNHRISDVLGLFYSSLLNHTAHVYFIPEQLQRHSADKTCTNPKLNASAISLASDMRELMCMLRLTILTLKVYDNSSSIEDSIAQILNEQLVDQPLCSRRSIRDCQIVYSTVSLLNQLSNFLHSTVLINGRDDSPSTESSGEIVRHLDATSSTPGDTTSQTSRNSTNNTLSAAFSSVFNIWISYRSV